jgi:hypothetical protein
MEVQVNAVHMPLVRCWPDITDDVTTTNIIFTAINKIYVMIKFTDITYTKQQLCFICQKQNQSKEKQYGMKKPPVNPTLHPYLRVMWQSVPWVVGHGNRCGGVPCRGLLWHTLANSVIHDPLGEPGLTPLYVGLMSKWAPWMVTISFSHFVGQPLKWGLWEMDEWMNHWLWKRSISLFRGPIGGPWRGGSLTGDSERKARFCVIRSCVLGTPGDM